MPPSLAGLRERLAVDSVLTYLRKSTGPYLRACPTHVGFSLHRVGGARHPHGKGPDSPTKRRQRVRHGVSLTRTGEVDDAS
jgi:hypothetical protein